MEQRHNLPRLCFLLTGSLALLGVILRTVCMLCFFDADIGYFSPGILPTLSNILYFAAVLAPVVCMAKTPKDSLSDRFIITKRSIVAILLGLVLAAFTVVSLLICFPARRSNMMIGSSLLGILSATYYLLSADREDRYPDWLSFLGFLPVLWSIAAVADTYFDVYTTMNSPDKISLQMGFLGFMLMMLGELRFRIGKPLPRYTVIFLSIGSYTCLVGSVPLLVAACAGIFDHFRHTLYAAVLLFAGLYGLYLLFRYTHSPIPSDTAEASSESTDSSVV